MTWHIGCQVSPDGWLDLVPAGRGQMVVIVQGETVGTIRKSSGDPMWRTFDVNGRETFLGSSSESLAARNMVELWASTRGKRIPR